MMNKLLELLFWDDIAWENPYMVTWLVMGRACSRDVDFDERRFASSIGSYMNMTKKTF